MKSVKGAGDEGVGRVYIKTKHICPDDFIKRFSLFYRDTDFLVMYKNIKRTPKTINY